jgi:hypothetical protein
MFNGLFDRAIAGSFLLLGFAVLSKMLGLI